MTVLSRTLVGPSRRVEAVFVTLAYATIVVWAAIHHEPWRDEVVPLSIARQAGSLAELAAPLKYEGHPILWYLVLWVAYAIVGQTWVLKAASVAAAVAAIVLLNRSPLPWWIRWPFTFSFFPLYQYSVVSRGYCLVMLLLFAFCALHPRRRAHPFAVALVLAALANTEAFGFIMAVAAVAMLLAEGAGDPAALRRAAADRRVQAGAVALLCGFAIAAAVAFPDAGHRGTGVRQLDLAGLAAGVGNAILRPAAHSTHMLIVPWPSLWVWAWFAYLAGRPPLLAFAAISLVGFEVLFNLAHGPGAPWHIGNVVLAIVATTWLDAATPATPAASSAIARARTWLGRALAAGALVVLLDHVWLGVDHVRADLAHEHSSNQRLAALLASDATLANAVVMGEPDTPLWSLSYYADNRIYLPREATFRDWGIFVPSRLVVYELSALLDAARRVRASCACPVVVTLGWDLAGPGAYTTFPGTRFEERFVVTPEARAEFLATMQPLARLRGPTITDENYDVWVLR